MTWSINYWRNKETQYPGSTKSNKTKQLHQLSVCPKLYTAVFQQWSHCPPQGTAPSDISVPMASPDPALIRHCLPIARTKHPLTPLPSNNDLTHPRIAQDVVRKWGRGWSSIKRDGDPLLALHAHINSHSLPSWPKIPLSGGLRWRCDSAKINMSCGLLGVFFYRKNASVCKL